MARRLSLRPGREVHAAERYLPVVDAIDDQVELRRLIDLFRIAAHHARMVADHTRAERFISAACALAAPAGPVPVPTSMLVDLTIDRHAALYSLGRSSRPTTVPLDLRADRRPAPDRRADRDPGEQPDRAEQDGGGGWAGG